jgi:hypothetical protein
MTQNQYVIGSGDGVAELATIVSNPVQDSHLKTCFPSLPHINDDDDDLRWVTTAPAAVTVTPRTGTTIWNTTRTNVHVISVQNM